MCLLYNFIHSAHIYTASISTYNVCRKKTHLPQRPELPLLDAQQLSGFPRDDGGVPGGVVQDGFPKRRSGPQRANNDGILARSGGGASCELFPRKSLGEVLMWGACSARDDGGSFSRVREPSESHLS